MQYLRIWISFINRRRMPSSISQIRKHLIMEMQQISLMIWAM